MNPDVRRARHAFLWVGVLAPTAVTLLSAIVIAVWLPQLPDPAATHWSGGGGPDGFGPAWTYLLFGVGLPLVLIAGMSVMALYAHRLPPRDPDGPQWSPTARLLGAMNLAIAGMFAVMMLASVGVQRGLADAADAPDVMGWMFAGFGVAVVLGVAAWFLQPAVVPAELTRQDAVPLPLGPGERAAWVATATTARAGIVTLGSLTGVLIVMTVVMLALEVPAWWIVAIVNVALVAAMLTMLTFRVRVGSDGLLVRSTAGWPRFRIRPDEVRSVRATNVHPFAEFGGWGVRLSTDGRFGVVLRAGDALEVTRTNGRTFVVTVDDAATGAALLSAVCADAASGRDREGSR
ncbi:DUF1648 domain-containing protein [Microbacterium protaetiae]|uniref:DUF1648 domain-containing protein n=1 Tax=Microbacterium protaetiae TaxID=2509458 RepID=A0A4P6EG93_9MICO|nr:DUF1648 domain-containing protein [Microbacterium protaetiae]QAY60906.1 DUF1648 domain-containing protein [Microbacterium protaetiae]